MLFPAARYALRATSRQFSLLQPRLYTSGMGSAASTTASPNTAKLVDGMIADSKSSVLMFSLTTCPFCDRSKDLMETQYPDVPFKVVEVDERPDGADIRSYLKEKTGQRTLPNIFIKERHIGGCDNLMALDRTSELSQLLADLVGRSGSGSSASRL